MHDTTIFNSSFSRRNFLKATGIAGLTTAMPTFYGFSAGDKSTLNIVIITTDDNDAESVGCFGCPLPEITPNMDNLAREGVRFEHAHTPSPTCQPCRLSLMTGRYPQTNGNTGHCDPIKPGIATLSGILSDAGYYTAIIGKQANYLPESAFKWSRCRDANGAPLDADIWDDSSDGYWSMWRSPEGFYKGTRQLISEAKEEGKPFFLHLNTSDPHRPWPGNVDEIDYLKKYTGLWEKHKKPLRPYAKNYSLWEVPIPGYLPDLPGVRVDVAQYYSALHNGDKAVGRMLDALREEGVYEHTIIIYFGDQGAPFPTSKQNLYRYSTRIPLIMKWPGVTKPSRVITDTMVSVIDIMPTLLEGLGIECDDKIDGKSFLPLIKGDNAECRDYIYSSYNYAYPGIQAFPMRAVQSREYLYIYNGWCGENNISPKVKLVYDGQIDPLIGFCWKAMKDAAQTDPEIKKRVDFIKHRVSEEFYNLSRDPFCLNNLIHDAHYSDTIKHYKQLAENQMAETGDPIIHKFRGAGPLPPEWLTYTKKQS